MGGKKKESLELLWRTGPLMSNPFDLIVGLEFEHRVHYSSSNAMTTTGVRKVLLEVVGKTLSLAATNVGPDTAMVLFHFDTTDGTLRGIYCDSACKNDSTDVVVCQFHQIGKKLSNLFAPLMEDESLDEIEWRTAMSLEGTRMKKLLADILSCTDLTTLGTEITVVYSEDDRLETTREFKLEVL